MVYGLHLASSILNIVGCRLQSSLSIIRPRKSACWFPFPGIHSGSYSYVWPFLHSGNTIPAPSMVCHWKLVATNWLEKGSDLSSHVQTTAVFWGQPWICLLVQQMVAFFLFSCFPPLPSWISQFSLCRPCPMSVRGLCTRPQLATHTLIYRWA